MNNRFVVDTHAILWFLIKDKRLSYKAHSILVQAEQGQVEILISTIVLAELLYICEKAKSSIPFKKILQSLVQNKSFTVVPFDFSIFKEMLRLTKELEMHDRIIVATAQLYNAKIITKDRIIKKLSGIDYIW